MDWIKRIGLAILTAICIAIPPLLLVYFLAMILLFRNSNRDSEADKLKKRYKLTDAEVVDIILNKKTVEQIYAERDRNNDVTIRTKIKLKTPVYINQNKRVSKSLFV